jgi:hypothetical protein
MNLQVAELLQSFETDSKAPRKRYNDFLAHVYTTMDKKISMCKTDKEMNKYKKMRMSILRYIVANEKAIIVKISK